MSVRIVEMKNFILIKMINNDMEKRYKHFSTIKEEDVLDLLELWRKNGWNLPNIFISITHGPDGFHVFYDAKLDNPPR